MHAILRNNSGTTDTPPNDGGRASRSSGGPEARTPDTNRTRNRPRGPVLVLGLAALLAAQIGLALWLQTRGTQSAPGRQDAALLTFSPAAVDRIKIEARSQACTSTRLRKYSNVPRSDLVATLHHP